MCPVLQLSVNKSSVTKGAQAFFTCPVHQLFPRSWRLFWTCINCDQKEEFTVVFSADDSLTFADPPEKFVPVVLSLDLSVLSPFLGPFF